MFNTGIVLYYIKENSLKESINVKNEILKYVNNNTFSQKVQEGSALDNLVENLPVGAVICADLSNTSSLKTLICLPMFSSHLSLPLKLGEVVWYYQDSFPFSSKAKEGTPLLTMDSYWLTRKIGLKISEDLNYSHIQRDTIISDLVLGKSESFDSLSSKTVVDKVSKKKQIKEEEKKINIPDYESKKIYSNRYTFIPSTKDLYLKSKQQDGIFPAAVPRWSSKPYELTLQGSNNSLINLTKTYTNEKDNANKGAIDIVAGRHFLKEFIEPGEDSIHVIKDKFARNISDVEKRSIKELKFDKSNPVLKIKNADDDFELLKSQKYYFGETFSEDTVAEGNVSLSDDASRIYVTEADNVDSASFYNTAGIQSQRYIPVYEEDAAFESEITKDYFQEETLRFSNFGSSEIKVKKNILPSIFIKSNNIRLVAREKFENKSIDKSLEEGSIRIVKQSNEPSNYAHISLESNGDIAVDGKSILLGNISKEYVRQGIAASHLALPDEEKLGEMHGNGYGVLIGYDETLSEPLVLGSTLEVMLKELIHINISLVEEIKILTDDLKQHIHLGIPGSGVSGPPQVPGPYIDFSTTSQESIILRYENIQNNLREMLSRFAKTS